MSKLKIAIVAPFEETVPPQGYGGTEQMVNLLTEELAARGHTVTLFAAGGSRTSAQLYPVFERSLRQDPSIMGDMAKREAYKFIGQGKVLAELQKGNFDIIHSHISWRLIPFHSLVKTPIVTTIHYSLEHDTIKGRHVPSLYPEQPYISISNAQRTHAPNLNYIATVYNGIDIEKFEFNSRPRDYLAFLGRMSPEKGPLQAIQIAKMTGKNLIMAAKLDDADRDFYQQQVAPLIDGRQIKFIGEASFSQKVDLLKNAQALLAPIQWDEPFGLYFIEAMACGTPVLSIARGSAPEVVQHGQTGFLAGTLEQLAAYIAKIPQLDRRAVYQIAVSDFSYQRMVDGYENAYRKVLNR